ncbi:TetR/AcrR family transcriptional regulator [Mycobacteroides franklinii]|uniref:TetR/AcrR family transcriptional regulator n=1 Tax=Mycobacteroides franklinii TaxID=948102 RepID=A0A4R5PC31_9MYCO|nr:TetR/AcrR family transcriptional regulator [Mycobacteroides franklinii]TDH22336.1 TetR/AcrR family transcriptional regulator [Mycobacteroides franklinii]
MVLLRDDFGGPLVAGYFTRPYRGLSAEQWRSKRRQRFLEVGLEAMASSGGRATVASITATAGCSARYFYQCFEGVESFLVEIFDWIVEECSKAAVVAIEISSGEPYSHVKAIVIGVVDALTVDPCKARFLLDPAIGGSRLASLRGQLTGDVAFMLRQILEENTSHHDTRLLAVQAEGLVAGVTGLIRVWLDGQLSLTREELAQQCGRYIDEAL